MGTRADFYIGTGQDAEWLGSVAWDGYEWEEAEGCPLMTAKTEDDFRKAVGEIKKTREDFTSPEEGWPWPWEDSTTTDRAYSFSNGKTTAYQWGEGAEWPNMMKEEIMGLVTGNVSITKYDVPGCELTNALISDRLQKMSFRDIDNNYEEFSVGWVSCLDMFNSDFSGIDHHVGNYVVFSLRVDQRKVPAAILKKCIQKEMRSVMSEKNIPRLPMPIRVEIKERVKSQLIKKSVPTPSVTDVVWNLEDDTIIVLSSKTNILNLFEEFFFDTFGVRPEASVNKVIVTNMIDDNIGGDFMTYLSWRISTGAISWANIIDTVRLDSDRQTISYKGYISQNDINSNVSAGKRVSKLKVEYCPGDLRFTFSVDSNFNVTGVSLPKGPELREGGEDGFLLDRIIMVETVDQFFSSELKSFSEMIADDNLKANVMAQMEEFFKE